MNIEIIEYEDFHQPIFKALNVVWLENYNLMEDHDRKMLNDPREFILKNGGVIYLAKHNNEIVGSAALINEHNGMYELAKMTVAASHQQMGISKLLLEKCLEKARALKAKYIVLFSNSQLKAALALYEKYGFQHVAVEDSPFVTADVKMELAL